MDAEVRRLTAARARWCGLRVRSAAPREDRARRADYDKKIEALHETQTEYKAAYERAKLEIVAAAEEEKKAERRERDADAEKNAARWRASAVQTQQRCAAGTARRARARSKTRAGGVGRALAAARAAAAETEETRVDTPDETRLSRFFETTRSPTPRASDVSRSKDASSSAKRPRKVSGVTKGLEGLEGLDVNALDFKASGLLDDADRAAPAPRRRRKRSRRRNDRCARTSCASFAKRVVTPQTQRQQSRCR